MGKIVGFFRIISSLSYWFVNYITKGKPHNQTITDERIVLIGNGKSAKEFPFEKFVGFSFCCVNYFANEEELFRQVKPKYYCCIDPNLFCYGEDEFINGKTRRLFEIIENVDWEMTFICMQGNKIKFNNPLIRVSYINNNFLKYNEKMDNLCMRLYSKNAGNFGFENVIIASLYYFIAVTKAKSVVLTGVENDWHREYVIDCNNNIYREYTHFYGTTRLLVTDSNVKKGEFYKEMYSYYITLYQYAIASKLAKYNDIEIVNSVEKSYIDVFDKMEVEDVYKKYN